MTVRARAVVAALALAGCGGAGPTGEVRATNTPRHRAAAATRDAPALVVRSMTLRLVDRTRRVPTAGGGSAPRAITTIVRYPVRPGARSNGPYPLVVFGHGFALTPRRYRPLLRAWARAGYVVAAPVFPREAATAPGGPDESDLVNQPADVRLVISRLLAADARPRGRLSGLIASQRIAVAGHSDGGDTALAVAYDPRFADPRVRAAIVLAGAMIPQAGPFRFPASGPPLLAVQGTADAINRPEATSAFYLRASRPKVRLSLLGAGHLGPYSAQQPQLGIVERVTIGFLDRHLKDWRIGPRRLRALIRRPRLARLHADL